MLTEQIHGLEQLLGVDEGDDKDKRTENAPVQEDACAEAIVDASASQLVADSVGQLVDPDNENDTQSKTGEDEDNKAVVQGLLAIISADNGVALDSGSLSDLGMILHSRTAGK